MCGEERNGKMIQILQTQGINLEVFEGGIFWKLLSL